VGIAEGYFAIQDALIMGFHTGQVFRQVAGSESQIVAKVKAVPIKI